MNILIQLVFYIIYLPDAKMSGANVNRQLNRNEGYTDLEQLIKAARKVDQLKCIANRNF